MDILSSIGKLLLYLFVAAFIGWGLFHEVLNRADSREERKQQVHLMNLLDDNELHEGDLIFHTSQSAQSQAIQLATHSPYSHCGILYKEAGRWQVFEAIQPVQLTPLAVWIARGSGEHFVVKRLKTAGNSLAPSEITRLKDAGRPMLGHKYDLYFGWSDDRIYCSELIWKVYERGLGRQLGQLQQLRDFDLSNPAVQAKLRERYGNRLPLNETVISPASIFNSPELVTVLNR
ncbi:YiiX family permuted papain-like enzyme [Hymenobacter sp. DH14]|uniref:YiiX family permuted papain-like enzyme n=1 Tax=Hymenobacter cyanobacteriorum TaxID=2926463 RepID=A0A9X1VBN9_9BACT|nr:YiiX family permuted papain-like enzyme [Hymenobacter cyanobacteriorum]MCI1186104.1 YiiX family permuted papain-like enzyme [Hymenobacter cyanobacteriorum]